MSVTISLVRIGLDILVLTVAARLSFKFLNTAKSSFLIKKDGHTEKADISAISEGPCHIEHLCIDLMLGSSIRKTTEDKGSSDWAAEIRPSGGVYLAIKVIGSFKMLSLGLPLQIERVSAESYDNVEAHIKPPNTIVFYDRRETPGPWEIVNTYIPGTFALHRRPGRLKVAAPIFSPWASGSPYGVGRPYPRPGASDKTDTGIYTPEIKYLEITAVDGTRSLIPDIAHSSPPPDVVLDNSMRWFSGVGRRPHSSVTASFIDEAFSDTTELEKFWNAALIALFSSLAISTFLDALWTFVSSIESIWASLSPVITRLTAALHSFCSC